MSIDAYLFFMIVLSLYISIFPPITIRELPDGSKVSMILQSSPNIWWHTDCGYNQVAVESTALGWLKVRRYVEVPEQDKHLSLLSVYGCQLAIGYFGVVKSRGVSSPSFLGGVRCWGLTLAVWNPLQKVVLIWLASCWGEIVARILCGGYADTQGVWRR
jgi:hypothetical protein